MGDVNGTARDLAVANNGSDSVGVMAGQWRCSFQAQQTYTTTANSRPDAVAIGDLNGDGSRTSPSPLCRRHLSVFLGNGDGVFSSAADLHDPLIFPLRWRSGFERDGKPDWPSLPSIR